MAPRAVAAQRTQMAGRQQAPGTIGRDTQSLHDLRFATVTVTRGEGFSQLSSLTSLVWPEPTVLPAALAGRKWPGPNTPAVPKVVALRYVAAALAVRPVRIMLLTSEIKELRTPDPCMPVTHMMR